MKNWQFTLDGWDFLVTEPANDTDPRQFEIIATKDGETKTHQVPMMYPNIFGVDVADRASLSEALETFSTELGIDPEAQPENIPFDPLDRLL